MRIPMAQPKGPPAWWEHFIEAVPPLMTALGHFLWPSQDSESSERDKKKATRGERAVPIDRPTKKQSAGK